MAGWVSLFTLHVMWPFLWIWATLYRPERGWGFQQIEEKQRREESLVTELEEKVNAQSERLERLEQLLAKQTGQNGEGNL